MKRRRTTVERHEIGSAKHEPPAGQLHLRVQQGVLDRMFRILDGTSLEDGGKLLGNIIQRERGSTDTVEVVSFLDSGPRVSNSRSHLMPDGEYQERLFRLVESFDPAIEHIGSWHSHHCNGFPTLSGGDIEGYLKSINDRNYRPRYFIAILIITLTKASVVPKYFWFSSDRGGPFEVPPSEVEITSVPHVAEPVLVAAQDAALRVRRGSDHVRAHSRRRAIVAPSPDDIGALHEMERRSPTAALCVQAGHKAPQSGMNRLRLEDKAWFGERFPDAELRTRGGSRLFWRWHVMDAAGNLVDVEWHYPQEIARPGSLEWTDRNGNRRTKEVALNEERFAVIEATLAGGGLNEPSPSRS